MQGIKQFFVAVEREEWKFDTLCDLYDTLTITQVGGAASCGAHHAMVEYSIWCLQLQGVTACGATSQPAWQLSAHLFGMCTHGVRDSLGGAGGNICTCSWLL